MIRSRSFLYLGIPSLVVASLVSQGARKESCSPANGVCSSRDS